MGKRVRPAVQTVGPDDSTAGKGISLSGQEPAGKKRFLKIDRPKQSARTNGTRAGVSVSRSGEGISGFQTGTGAQPSNRTTKEPAINGENRRTIKIDPAAENGIRGQVHPVPNPKQTKNHLNRNQKRRFSNHDEKQTNQIPHRLGVSG